MTTPLPPPLPTARSVTVTESARATYLKAFATILPTLFFAFYANLFLAPKLERLWESAGLAGSKVQWFLDASSFLSEGMKWIFLALVPVLITVEHFIPGWPRYRRTIISLVAVGFHTLILIGISTIATAVLIAAPLVFKDQ